jgi:hypothetical protein
MTKIEVVFSIYGDDLNPSLITEFLKINPTQNWRKGEKIRNKVREESCWELSTGLVVSLELGEVFNRIYEILIPKFDSLQKLSKVDGTFMKFIIQIKIENNQTAGIFLTNDMINLAHSIGAEIDISTYIY